MSSSAKNQQKTAKVASHAAAGKPKAIQKKQKPRNLFQEMVDSLANGDIRMC